MLTFNHNVICKDSKWLYYNYDPCNPLNLPPFTARLRFTDGYTPVWDHGTLTQVSSSPNLWDFTYESTDWSYALSDSNNYNKLLEVMGANTTGVTNMSYMLYMNNFLERVALFDTSSVTNMEGMFSITGTAYNGRVYGITTIPKYDTSNVTNMQYMFNSSSNLSSVPLFDTSSVTTMQGMFYDCDALRTIPLFNTSNVTNMSHMFGCNNSSTHELVDGIPLLDTSSVTNMYGMFEGSKVSSIPLFNTSSVTNMAETFRGTSVASLPALDTSAVTNMAGVCLGCANLTSMPQWNTANVLTFTDSFRGCTSLASISLLDTSSAESVNGMFSYCYNVAGGALAMYNQLASQAVSPPLSNNHKGTFYMCGSNTTTGAAELAQIPSNWKEEP